MTGVDSTLENWSKLSGLFLVLLLEVSVPSSAQAQTGPCGLEAGIWGISPAACALAKRPDEAARQFGGEALLELEKRNYVQDGAVCGIFSNETSGSTCKISFECERAMGHTDIEIVSNREIKFGKKYIYCGKGVLPFK
jgi:hypothetical protein